MTIFIIYYLDKSTVDLGPHVSADKLIEALVKVAASGDPLKCEQILRMRGLTVNGIFAGHTALQAASQNGHVNVIRVLLKHGADPEIEDKDGDRAIHHAAFGNEPEVIDLLASVAGKCDLNARNKRRQTAMHIGVNKVHLNVVRVLVKFHAHVSLQDMDADTPIHDAITKKNDAIIKLLLDANADLSICNNNGFNPIQHAALRGNTSAIKLIIEKLKEQDKSWLIDEKKEDGFSPIHLACLNNHCEVVRALVHQGKCNINIQNLSQQTALHLAIDRQHFEVIKLLLDAKCEVNVQNKEGDNPLHCLIRNYNLSHLKQYVSEKVSG